jgi:hypothetical protein
MIYSENDPNNQYTWSKSRSKESDNFIVYWDKYYGNTNPTNAPSTYRVDIDDLLKKCEGFYAKNIGELGFCDEGNSNVSKYKMMVLLNHTTEWVCYGGGYDDVIGALWLSPSTSKPVGHSVAHEVGHSFQYQVYADLKGYSGFRTAIGSGSTFWEQTAQWQANQSYPALKWEQSWNLFMNTHNYAMTHEWHRYQSYWWHYYLTEKYGIDVIGELWRFNPGYGADPNESFMKMMNMDASDLYMEYFKANYSWGYSTPYFISGMYCCHVNNIAYLLKNHRTNARDMNEIIKSLDPQDRLKYDYDLLEEKYIENQNRVVDDVRNLFKYFIFI